MDTKTKIIVVFLILLLSISISLSYIRAFVTKNFEISEIEEDLILEDENNEEVN